MKSALILFAHGSRDPAWAGPFKTIQALIHSQKPTVRTELAFLELMQPSLTVCIETLVAAGIQSISIVPLFLAAGRHLREDLPAIVEPMLAAHAGLKISISPPIGEMVDIQQAIANIALSSLSHH